MLIVFVIHSPTIMAERMIDPGAEARYWARKGFVEIYHGFADFAGFDEHTALDMGALAHEQAEKRLRELQGVNRRLLGSMGEMVALDPFRLPEDSMSRRAFDVRATYDGTWRGLSALLGMQREMRETEIEGHQILAKFLRQRQRALLVGVLTYVDDTAVTQKAPPVLGTDTPFSTPGII